MNVLLAVSQRCHDVVPLLLTDQSRLFSRGIRYHQPPGDAPDQAERALHVEDGLPAEIRGQQAGQQD